MTEVTVQALDVLVNEAAELKAKHSELKELATKAHDEYEKVANKLIGLLKACNRTNHTVPGVGQFRFQIKESYRVPADAAAKAQLFKYIEDTHGTEALREMLSIHAAKINAWANAEIESNPGLQIPGLEAPTMTETPYFTKK